MFHHHKNGLLFIAVVAFFNWVFWNMEILKSYVWEEKYYRSVQRLIESWCHQNKNATLTMTYATQLNRRVKTLGTLTTIFLLHRFFFTSLVTIFSCLVLRLLLSYQAIGGWLARLQTSLWQLCLL